MSSGYDSIYNRYIDAVIAFESGLILGAQYILEDLLTDYESHHDSNENLSQVDIMIKLSNVYICLKHYTKAIEILQKAIQIDPENLRVLGKLFKIYKDLTHNERSAIDIYVEMDKIINNNGGDSMSDYPIYQSIKYMAIELQKKNSAYMLLKYENNDKVNTLQQNLTKQLPTELVYLIMSFLDLESLFNATLVCKDWRNVLLSLPSLFGSFIFKKPVGTTQLETFLRIFDQKADMSKVILPKLFLMNASLSNEISFLKVLLGSKILTNNLTYYLKYDFPPKLKTLAEASGSKFFKEINTLTLVSDVSAYFKSIPKILSIISNIKILDLKIFGIYNSNEGEEIFKNQIDLLNIVQISILSHFNLKKEMKLLIDKLYTPNIKRILIENLYLEGIILKLCKMSKNFSQICFTNISLSEFFRDVINHDDIDKIPNYESLKVMKFFSCQPVLFRDQLIRNPIIKFPNLRHILFKDCKIFLNDFKNVLKTCNLSLEQLTIINPSFAYGRRSPTQIFRLIDIFEMLPRLKIFKLIDENCFDDDFEKLLKEVLISNKIYTFDYFLFDNGSMGPNKFNDIITGIFNNQIKIKVLALPESRSFYHNILFHKLFIQKRCLVKLLTNEEIERIH